jgi:hypothetical protein
LRRIRAETAAVLKVEDIAPSSAPSSKKAPASNPGATRYVAQAQSSERRFLD